MYKSLLVIDLDGTLRIPASNEKYVKGRDQKPIEGTVEKLTYGSLDPPNFSGIR